MAAALELARGFEETGTPFGDAWGLGPQSVFELQKALLTTGYGTDVATFTGGQALRVQSLDQMLYDVVWQEEHTKLFKLLKKSPIYSTVDEWTERSEYGSPWGAVAGEADNPPATTAELARRVGYVKFYRTYREVSHVATVVRNIVEAIAEEEQAGTRFLLGHLERDCFFGDSSVIPEQIDGLLPIILNNGDDRCVIDLQGQPLNSRELIHHAASVIGSNAGVPTHLFVDPYAKADLDVSMLPAERFVVPTRSDDGLYEVDLGIGRIATSWGKIEIVPDIFLAPERGWFNRKSDPLYRAPSTARGGDSSNPAPDAPTGVTASAGGSGGNIPAGTYYYKVSAVNRNGESAAVSSGAVAVTAGQKVTLTITHTDSSITGFRIYRSAKDAADDSDCRYLYHCAADAGGTTQFVDDGSWVPGTTCAFLIDMHRGDPALDWRQLLPMMKLELAIVKPAVPWLQMIYGFLRVTRPWRLVVFKNILPTAIAEAGWNPLGA